MIHSGSRGLGHQAFCTVLVPMGRLLPPQSDLQVATDALVDMERAMCDTQQCLSAGFWVAIAGTCESQSANLLVAPAAH